MHRSSDFQLNFTTYIIKGKETLNKYARREVSIIYFARHRRASHWPH